MFKGLRVGLGVGLSVVVRVRVILKGVVCYF